VALSYLIFYPGLMVGSLILAGAMGAILPGLIYVLRYRNTDFLWAFPYCMFLIPAVSWVSLYALMTPQRNRWMTRDLTTAQLEQKAGAPSPEPAVVPLGFSNLP
jgi:hyaluronan synthase